MLPGFNTVITENTNWLFFKHKLPYMLYIAICKIEMLDIFWRMFVFIIYYLLFIIYYLLFIIYLFIYIFIYFFYFWQKLAVHLSVFCAKLD